MHLRKLVLACGFASFALSNYASALGLGEVKLKSTLNQPLSAEVQLLDTKGLSSEQIIVALASSAEFERNGLDFVHFYTEFRFEVALDNPGGPVVRITSRNPVREPYLNFLVEAKWTAGRLLREYTLLMDLPTFDDAAAPQAVQAAKTAPAQTATATPRTKKAEVVAPVTQTPADTATATEEKPDIIAEQDQPSKKSKVAAGTYGPVGDKDTLWDIALAVRPDSGASVHQTMLALQRLNPDAFIRGNINLLKKGQVLRVPDATEISNISQSEAVRQFNAQTAEWSGGTTSQSNTALGAQLDASRRTTGERAKSEAVTGRVKLEAPSSKERAASGQGSGSNKGSGKALESELAATLEELDKAKSEKTELSSRVHDLEDQVKTMQRLVDVSNEKLRALQLNASKQPDKATAADKKAADTKPADTKLADTKTSAVASSAQANSSAAAATEAVSSAAASAAPKKPAIKPAPQPVEPEKTIVDQIFDNILWVGLGAVALLAAGGVVLARRRKSQAEAQQSNTESDDLFAEEPGFDSFNQTHEEESAIEPSADEMSLFDEEDTTAVAETGDVVGEADIYIAYGKFDQAEEMLVNGLAKDPASTDIRLKLLEVYSHTQNATEFDKHYAALLPLASGFALSRAKELRAGITGIGEFNPDVAQAQPAEKLDFNEDFNLDDFDVEPAVTTSTGAHTGSDDFDFDLELDDDKALAADLDLDSSTTNYGMDFSDKANAHKGTASLDDDFTLDFDDAPAKHAEAEDLSDISLALDSLDDDGLPDDIEISKREEDEFSFDFNDLDDEPSSLAKEANSITSSELNEDETLGDDFNLEMDVNNVDLAALDNEMANFDAELDMLDDEDSVTPAATAAAVKTEFAGLDDDDFKLDSLDDDLADLDSSLELEDFDAGDEFDELEAEFSLDDEKLAEGESLAELDESLETELDDSEFSWEEDEAELEEPVVGLAESELDASEELNLDDELSLDEDDDFDIDSPVELADDLSLDDLDETLAEEAADTATLDLSEVDLSEDDSLESLFEEDDVEEPVPAVEEELAQLDNIDEDAIEEVAEAADTSGHDDLSDDDVFEQALSDFSAESLAMDDSANMSDDDMDAELDFMADADEAATKLDLARAYMDMGDNEGARDILAEVAHEGNDEQRKEAVDLLSRIDA